jgi:VCBS repeat-containing protein
MERSEQAPLGVLHTTRTMVGSRSVLSSGVAVVLVLAVIAALFTASGPAHAAGSPNGDVAGSWPTAWTPYRLADGTSVYDTNGDENPSDTDLYSGPTGADPTVYWAASATNAYFRMRINGDLYDASKGGLRSSVYLVQIAVGTTTVAVVGVDGKSPSVDYVYTASAPGTNVVQHYTWPFDNSGGQSSTGMRVVADGTGHYFLDFQVPLSRITTASGGTVTAATPVKLYYGSSSAANLATINKDFMRGNVSAASFTGLADITLAPASVTLDRTVAHVGGPAVPTAGVTSTYDVALSATSAGADLAGVNVTAFAPAGVTIDSVSTATGSISHSDGTVAWAIGSMTSGNDRTATIRVSITPGTDDVGSILTILDALAASGTDVSFADTRTATAADVTVGPVVANEPPTAGDDATNTDEDRPVTVMVLDNDTDPESGALAVNGVSTDAENGTVTFTADSVTYTPDPDWNGTDSFTYEVCDPAGSCDTATVTITVGSVNDAPIAAGDDELTTDEDTRVDGTVTGTDVDGDSPLTYGVATDGTHGTVAIDPETGAYTYTPDPDWHGTDTFTLEVCDPDGACGTLTGTVSAGSVNDAPIAAGDDELTTDEDTRVDGTVTGTDVDGDSPLTYGVATDGTHGTVAIDPETGAYTYTPDPDWHGTDTFTLEVCDPDGACGTLTVTVEVAPVNDTPNAVDRNTTGTVDTTVTVDVSSDATDVDGDELTFSLVEGPAGTTVTDAGAITVDLPATPGAVTVTYEVCDPDEACTTATVTIDVTAAPLDPPDCDDQAHTTTAILVITVGCAGNVAVDTDALHGTVTIHDDGTVTYLPDTGYVGDDVFSLLVCNDDGCTSMTVTVTVTVADSSISNPPTFGPIVPALPSRPVSPPRTTVASDGTDNLPATGSGITDLVPMAMALMAAGALMRTRGRSR